MATNHEMAWQSPGDHAMAATYEQLLAQNPRWAMSEGSLFFERKGAVQESLQRIAGRLNELQIPYAVAGGMALFHHGYRRFTEDVDILVMRDGLKAIHQALDGRGFVRAFERSKNLRDAENRVKIDFLLTGDFPGDGQPQAISFPDPAHVSAEFDGVRFITLPALVELKLASGMTGADRIKDLADVQELIKVLHLPQDFSTELNAAVRDKFAELWTSAYRYSPRYVRLVENIFRGAETSTPDELQERLRSMSSELAAMFADGIALDPAGSAADEFLRLVTTDPAMAKKYGMEDEREFWSDVHTGDE